MEKLWIEGGVPLTGEVEISGAKNVVLPLMAVSLLADGIFAIEKVPALNDIKMMAHLLRVIGSKVDYSSKTKTMTIDNSYCSYYEAPYELVNKMRASIYVLSPLLARFGQAKVSLPGGCAIGPRPIDLHLKALEQMGVKIEVNHGYIEAEVDRLKGAEIIFEKVSVGATVTVLMAAALAEGETVIKNAAVEPEVMSVVACLNAMGGKIEKRGDSELRIIGVEKLRPITFKAIPDRIEAGTFLIAAAVTKGEVKITGCEPLHIEALIQKLKEAGCEVQAGDDWVKVSRKGDLKPVDIVTHPYPLFPTDLQAQFVALMSLAKGTSVIEETIFAERFHHVPELNRLDANIVVEGNKCIVTGVSKLSGAEVMATDLRASAALIIAGLAAEGVTKVSRIYHLDRGYERIEVKLEKLGAKIKRIIA
ncbi:MAG: UDP-N-acetylglucosamine 1-carboxyvinyltransferase [Candidatus Cloacimonas sp.]|nr:UDP-N-acetylglucosamine 1-carboxyvinyltransferase [Candidatus Cloacimonadota bacterium]